MRKLYADNIDSASLQQYLEAKNIDLELTANPFDAAVTIRPGGREQCDCETLYIGGWIECPDAWAMAQELEISTNAMGSLLEHLNVKVRNCGLGCF